jgi:hypothetical protein
LQRAIRVSDHVGEARAQFVFTESVNEKLQPEEISFIFPATEKL